MRLTLAALALAALALQPADTSQIRLIVKGDDMGAAHGINVGTIKAFKDGILRTTNVIVAGPWFLEAAKMLRENPDLDVGVHLALTSEWDYVKWRPLTYAPSIVDADGYFLPAVVPRPGYPPGTSLKDAPWKIDEIERELRAQLDAARKHLPQATYTWYHMGFTMLDPAVRDVAARLTKEYGLVQATDVGFKPLGRIYEGTDSGAVKADKLAARLETLEPGLWLQIDHGSTNDPEMQAMGHRGYENVAGDRSANVEMWTSPKVREVIARRGIKLTNYRELTKK
jgi:chitin disaccharide deacetylase